MRVNRSCTSCFLTLTFRQTADKTDEKTEEKTDDAKMTDGTEDVAGASDEAKGEDAKVSPKKKKIVEPTSFSLANPSRVTPEQEQHVSFNLEQRYVPVNPRSKPAGIVVLVDRTPDEPQEVVQVKLPGSDSEKDEAAPPEPFEWSPDMQ